MISAVSSPRPVTRGESISDKSRLTISNYFENQGDLFGITPSELYSVRLVEDCLRDFVRGWYEAGLDTQKVWHELLCLEAFKAGDLS